MDGNLAMASLVDDSAIMQRVIFVGVHNKDGLRPLDSSTKSGKLIDEVILNLCMPYKKSNLYDCTYIDKITPIEFIQRAWEERVGYSSTDIIVTLGRDVEFRMIKYNPIALRHPSSVWSNIAKEQYIKSAVDEIIRRRITN